MIGSPLRDAESVRSNLAIERRRPNATRKWRSQLTRQPFPCLIAGVLCLDELTLARPWSQLPGEILTENLLRQSFAPFFDQDANTHPFGRPVYKF